MAINSDAPEIFMHKASMDYKGKDFHSDRVQQYAALRVAIAKQYGEESFGPTETHFLDDEEMTTQERKEQKDQAKASEGLIKIEYNRILEKVNDISHIFKKLIPELFLSRLSGIKFCI